MPAVATVPMSRRGIDRHCADAAGERRRNDKCEKREPHEPPGLVEML